MHEITISVPDEAYNAAIERARQEGFRSTEVYLSELLLSSMTLDQGNFDHLFTPQVLEAVARGAQEFRDGKSMTRTEVNEILAIKRSEWLRIHQSSERTVRL
jgi:hypothetical protein